MSEAVAALASARKARKEERMSLHRKQKTFSKEIVKVQSPEVSSYGAFSPVKLGHKTIANAMRGDKAFEKMQKRLTTLENDMNHVVKDLNSLNISACTQAMLNGLTVNMEQHIDSLRKQVKLELQQTTSDYVKINVLETFQPKVDFSQFVTRMNKLIRSKVKDVFVYEADPIFQRMWNKRERELSSTIKRSVRGGGGSALAGLQMNQTPMRSSSIANEDMDEVEDRAFDAMSGSAGDMMSLWKLAEKVGADENLERLIKAWLAFQAESLQKQENRFTKLEEKLDNIASSKHSSGGMQMQRDPRLDRQDLDRSKQEHAENQKHMEEDLERQKGMQTKLHLLEEKIEQSKRDMDATVASFKRQIEAINSKTVAMQEKMEEFYSQGVEFRAAVQQEVGKTNDIINAFGDDLDDMRGEFEKQTRGKKERRAQKNHFYQSERDKIIEEAKLQMQKVDTAKMEMLEMSQSLNFDKERMQRVWSKHSEKLESAISNATKVLQERSHSDISETILKMENKIWDRMHDIRTSIREDIRSKVGAVKARLNKEENAMHDVSKSVGEVVRLKEQLEKLAKHQESNTTELSSIRQQTSKLEVSNAKASEKGDKNEAYLKEVSKLQDRFVEEFRLNEKVTVSVNELAKTHSKSIRDLQQETKKLNTQKSSTSEFEDLQKEVKHLNSILNGQHSETKLDMKAMETNLKKMMSSRDASVTKMTNLLQNRISESNRKMNGQIEKLSVQASEKVANRALDFIGKMKLKKRSKSSSKRKNKKITQSNEARKRRTMSLSEDILGNTNGMGQETAGSIALKQPRQSGLKLKNCEEEKVHLKSGPGLPTIGETDASREELSEKGELNALDRIEEVIAAEKMWRKPHTDDGRENVKSESKTTESRCIADIEIPFFTHWPVLLEMCFPAAADWRNKVEKKLRLSRSSVDTDEEALARAVMERKPAIQKAIMRWWTELALENRANLSQVEVQGSVMSKQNYFQVHRKILKVFSNEIVKRDVATAAAEDDWGTDAGNRDGVDRQTFFSMVYELAWNFCGRGEANDYKIFLHAICSQISGLDYKEKVPREHKSLHARYESDLQKRDSVGQADPIRVDRALSTGAVVTMPPKHDTSIAFQSQRARPSPTKKSSVAEVPPSNTFREEYNEMVEKSFAKLEKSPTSYSDILPKQQDEGLVVHGANQVVVPLAVLEEIVWQQQALAMQVNTIQNVHKAHGDIEGVKQNVNEIYESMGLIRIQLTKGMSQISSRLEKERREWEQKQHSTLLDMKIANSSLLSELERYQSKGRNAVSKYTEGGNLGRSYSTVSLPRMRNFGGSFSPVKCQIKPSPSSSIDRWPSSS
jgi:hypothetical protein